MNNTINANKHDGTCEWITPKYILDELGEFDLDPCAAEQMPWRTAAVMLTKKDDGLKIPWDENARVWLNPPYGRDVPKWIKKMQNHKLGIMLVAARTDSMWWHEYIFKSCRGILFLQGRIRFFTSDGLQSPYPAGFPSALVAYSDNDASALAEARLSGSFVRFSR